MMCNMLTYFLLICRAVSRQDNHSSDFLQCVEKPAETQTSKQLSSSFVKDHSQEETRTDSARWLLQEERPLVVRVFYNGYPDLIMYAWHVAHSLSGCGCVMLALHVSVRPTCQADSLESRGGQNYDFRPMTYTMGGRGMECRDKYVTSWDPS